MQGKKKIHHRMGLVFSVERGKSLLSFTVRVAQRDFWPIQMTSGMPSHHAGHV